MLPVAPKPQPHSGVPGLPGQRTGELTDEERAFQTAEVFKCGRSCAYFIHTYCRVYDAENRKWVPFHLWPAQARVLKEADEHKLIVALKARQVGITWLFIARGLWLMLFRPVQSVLLFSRREEEAWHLLERMRGMYEHLPVFLQARCVVINNRGQWQLSNGSVARAFPTTAGDSYTSTFALADEFDLVENQQALIDAVQPTIEAGGQMALVSRADKDKPQSPFKKIYRAARDGQNDWHAIFLPWSVHPGRNREWYERKCADAMANTGSLDSIYEQYPANDAEALLPRTLNKRFAPEWLSAAYEPRKGPALPPAPAIPGLIVYDPPFKQGYYRIGADPAEGKEHGDDSSLDVVDLLTGQQVAYLSGKIEPDQFAQAIVSLSEYYNQAYALVERNNHGHAVILAIRKMGKASILINGLDNKPGWLTTAASKTLMFDIAAEAIREGDAFIHNFSTFTQLSMIEAATQRAPEGEHDDNAVSYALALLARARKPGNPMIPAARAGSLQRQQSNTKYPRPHTMISQDIARRAGLGARKTQVRRLPHG